MINQITNEIINEFADKVEIDVFRIMQMAEKSKKGRKELKGLK